MPCLVYTWATTMLTCRAPEMAALVWVLEHLSRTDPHPCMWAALHVRAKLYMHRQVLLSCRSLCPQLQARVIILSGRHSGHDAAGNRRGYTHLHLHDYHASKPLVSQDCRWSANATTSCTFWYFAASRTANKCAVLSISCHTNILQISACFLMLGLEPAAVVSASITCYIC